MLTFLLIRDYILIWGLQHIFLGGHNSTHKSPPSTMKKFMSFPCAKYIHSITTSPKVLTHSSLTQCPKPHLNIINSNSSKSVTGETLGVVHLETKFLVIYRLVKLENKLYTYKIQYWDTHCIDIFIP